jgi:hypothetical protein
LHPEDFVKLIVPHGRIRECFERNGILGFGLLVDGCFERRIRGDPFHGLSLEILAKETGIRVDAEKAWIIEVQF